MGVQEREQSEGIIDGKKKSSKYYRSEGLEPSDSKGPQYDENKLNVIMKF